MTAPDDLRERIAATFATRPAEPHLDAIEALVRDEVAKADESDYWWGIGWRRGYDDGLRDAGSDLVGAGEAAEDIPVAPKRHR